MIGAIATRQIRGTSERFGRAITPVGDVNGDGLADWCIGRIRCDTVVRIGRGTSVHERLPLEVLLYKGVRDGLPSVESGERIGPTELATSSALLTSGDYDADGHRDLVLAHEYILDTTENNPIHAWSPVRLSVFWGNEAGSYSVGDTTRLPCTTELWGGISHGTTGDFDNDGVDDLFIVSGGGFRAGLPVSIPRYQIFRGVRGGRWGRTAGHPRQPAWVRSSVVDIPGSTVTVLDQDCDGADDVVIQYDNNAGPSRTTVCYGRREGGFPDTNEVQTIEPTVANARASIFSDVTGDGSPDLVMNCGGHQAVKIFAGRPRQRLLTQYGSGLDEPIADAGWWRRPWAEIWTPERLDDGWTHAGYAGLLTLGDANGDGADEVWIRSDWILGYLIRNALDSLADIWIALPAPAMTGIANLGDIDGGGWSTIAIGYDVRETDLNFPFMGGVLYLKATDQVYDGGRPRPMPRIPGESCATAASVETQYEVRLDVRATSLILRAEYSGAGDISLACDMVGSGTGYLEVVDLLGRAVLARREFAGTATITAGELPAGAYIARVVIGSRSASTLFSVRSWP